MIRGGYSLQPEHSLRHIQPEMRGHGCQIDGDKRVFRGVS